MIIPKLNFLNKWRNYNKKSTYIIQKAFFESKQLDSAQKIKQEISNINKKIVIISQELIKSKATSLQTYFTKNQNIINRIQMQWNEKKFKEADAWHSDRLTILYQERLKLQEKLDRLTGNYWMNKIKKWLAILIISIISIVIIWILVMGLVTAIYLLPIWGSIVFLYLYLQRKKRF